MRGTTIGAYVLDRLLGRGGMGEVWAARAAGRDEVALKRLGPVGAADDAALAEISAVAALDHRHVMRILDMGVAAGERYLVTELAVASLSDRFPRRWAEVRAVLDAVLAALAHTHARGLLHLDVKPENVLWTEHGGPRWVLADFGLARYAGTRLDRLGGTPQFMAPERFRRGGVLSPAADLYAVGVLAYLLVTGDVPFDGTPKELANAHNLAEPPSRPARFPVPPGFEAWWRGLLAKAQDARPQLAADVRRALEALGEAELPAPDPFSEADAPTEDGPPTGGRAEAEPELVPLGDPAGYRPPARAVPGCALLDLRQLPLVGRSDELGALRQALARVADGDRARWVALEGPAGVGRRHLARSFAWRAEEDGLAAVGRSPGDGRPTIALRFGVRGGPVPPGPALVIAVDVEPPEPPLLRLTLAPLPSVEAVRLARNLAPLDEIALAHAVAGLGGHPGRIVARIRRWAVDGTLVDGPTGLVVDPARELGRDELGLPEGDPLAALAWQAEEDPVAAIPALSEALALPPLRRELSRARWLVALAERAVARTGTPDTLFRLRVHRARVLLLGGSAHVTAAIEASVPMVAAAREHGDPELLAQALIDRAHLLQHAGIDPRPLLEEAVAVSASDGTRGWALAVHGSFLILSWRPAEAVPLLERAAGLVASERLGSVLQWLGSAHQFAGDLRAARAASERAAEHCQRQGQASGEAHGRLRAAYACLALADRGEAERAMALARDAVARSENHMLRTELVSMEGLLCELHGELEAAALRFEEALERAREYQAGDAEHHLRLARVLARLGRRTEAAAHAALVADGAPGVVERAEVAAVRVATLPPGDPRFSASLGQLAGWLPEATRSMLDVVTAGDAELAELVAPALEAVPRG